MDINDQSYWKNFFRIPPDCASSPQVFAYSNLPFPQQQYATPAESASGFTQILSHLETPLPLSKNDIGTMVSTMPETGESPMGTGPDYVLYPPLCVDSDGQNAQFQQPAYAGGDLFPALTSFALPVETTPGQFLMHADHGYEMYPPDYINLEGQNALLQQDDIPMVPLPAPRGAPSDPFVAGVGQLPISTDYGYEAYAPDYIYSPEGQEFPLQQAGVTTEHLPASRGVPLIQTSYPSPGTDRIYCERCNRSYSRKDGLERHRKTLKEKGQQCNVPNQSGKASFAIKPAAPRE
ncbi:hypothetical protein BX666DRAFT_1942589 [Dichotomocladium elegans]|nr:hypothetical protein BX666DRAFT_1942589 [Dichotomocladium elegans]